MRDRGPRADPVRLQSESLRRQAYPQFHNMDRAIVAGPIPTSEGGPENHILRAEAIQLEIRRPIEKKRNMTCFRRMQYPSASTSSVIYQVWNADESSPL
jgi:hypothetical protein